MTLEVLIRSKNDPFTPDHQTRFTMRIDTELLDRIKQQAQISKRSTAKEIEFILEDWMNEHNPTK